MLIIRSYMCIPLIFMLFTLPSSVSFAKDNNTNSPVDIRNVTVGAFTVNVPSDWKEFSTSEAGDIRRQYMAQSKEIYRQYSGTADPVKSVDVVAFHISKDSGAFVIVSFTVPPQSDLIALLKSEIKDKMDWGVREGYIRKYLGLVSIDDGLFTGFYTKTIGKSGEFQVAGGIEHKKLKNTIIQLTLLCPKEWDEVKATNTLSPILKSVMIKKK